MEFFIRFNCDRWATAIIEADSESEAIEKFEEGGWEAEGDSFDNYRIDEISTSDMDGLESPDELSVMLRQWAPESRD